MENNDQQTYNKFGGFTPRLIAFTIDGSIALVLAFVLTAVIQALIGQPFSYGKNSPFRLIITLISIVYNIMFITLYGQTLGKRLFHLKVVNTSYQKLSFLQVLKREVLGKFISSLLFSLGYIWAAIDDKKQAWHDKIAKTYVIDTQPITYEQYLALQKETKSNLPIVLIVAGLAESILPLINTFMIVPRLARLYAQSVDNSYNPYVSYGLFGLIIILSVTQIIYGVILLNKQKALGSLTNNHKNIAKALMVIGIVSAIIVIPIIIITTILPIYKLTTSF